jgi:hypothetical protein
MPQVFMSNSIGQPTTEQVAQTQKVRFSPVTVDKAGGVTPAKEISGEFRETPAEASSPQETPKTEPKPKDPKQMQDEERFAAIVRREKAMRIKAREQESELAKYKAQVAEIEQFKLREEEYKQQELQRQERIKADGIGYLLEQGYTTDQITQSLLNQPGPESQLMKSLEAKISKLEKEQQDNIKRQQQEADNNYQNALKTIQRNVDKLVESNPEFEAIQAYAAQKQVTNYIEKVWKAEGEMLDVEDAAKEIEEYLTEQAVGVSKLKKVQSKLAPPTPKPIQQAAPKSPTLTNRTAQTTRPLTAKERAILAFNRQLK